MITKLQLSKLKGWHYPCISTQQIMTMSGWKFYIFGETIDDSYLLCEKLTPIIKRYNLTMKVATQNIINRNSGKPNIAWSIAVIYLNAEVFEDKKVGKLLEEINSTLTDYPKSGNIKGAKSINGKVHYRYDLKKPINPSNGLEYSDYLVNYRGEGGEYNIPENQDITSFLNN
jgi:hypothetical protein